MVSSHMLWQLMQASMHSCICWVGAGVICDWVMAPPGRRGPVADPVCFRPTSRRPAPHVTDRSGGPPRRQKGAPWGGAFPMRCETAARQGRLRAITIRWTWFMPS
ncbi:hypothetical protein GCM10010521_36070 [Streptomyces rameus]|uniref:Secreted protein n=1 Tax=Streptomyces rameus TaxID=68261 RepID=A0ABP6NEP9_9ACTN